MTKSGKSKLYANIALLFCSVIWGFAFVAQSVGMDYMGPFTFQSVRSLLGSAVLLPVLAVLRSVRKKSGKYKPMGKNEKKELLIGGTLCGIALCAASCLQQVGIKYTTVGKAGFITAMYIILVPVLSIFLKKKVPVKIWFCVVLAGVGLYFLSMKKGEFGISAADGMILACAFVFSVQILLVDHFAPKVDPICLSCIQFFVCGLIAAVPMFMFEHPTAAAILAGAAPILYGGVMSTGVAYTLQVVGQKYADASAASLLMSLESVFSMIGGIMILSQIPTSRELFGCILVFAAVIWSQLDLKISK